ncbi:MAG: polynucleotide kinase-phosphatase [Peptococcaceae bacterium]|jgi:protein phosphatase|nr:polynucleotide kinase-phosphatase [Peptococcaceae bacterium]
MRVEIPDFCLVALIGGTSSGKSTFAAQHFKSTEVLSSDFFRGLVADDENAQDASAAAFDALYYIARKRLEAMRLTVIDATNVQPTARRQAIELAKEQNCHAVAIVFNMPEGICRERNALRPDRQFPDRVIQRHCGDLRRSLRGLKKEGFRFVYILSSPQEAAEVELVRVPLWNDKKAESGPFDIIGDIHGCHDELLELLTTLGYAQNAEGVMIHPQGRRAVFLGDLCDRGPKNAAVLRLVMAMTRKGDALCVPGNHDVKLSRWLRGRDVQITHGLQNTIDELAPESEEFRGDAAKFLDGLISHYVLDGGKLVVAHAGVKEHFQGRGSMRVRDFCLYGETTGETDEYGLPVRLDWTNEYRGRAMVVYGHIPQVEPAILNNTYCLDTGCVFGGKLTALRYPERELVSVKARAVYYEPLKPLSPGLRSYDDMLTIDDVYGKLHLQTRLTPVIDVRDDNSAAALEVMSRFAADPHWLIYLPPTMSPCETSKLPDYLEYPTEAFGYYRNKGVEKVVCEKKHMGSRAIITLCRDAETARRRFGVTDNSRGIVYTRTGRRFFDDRVIEGAILAGLDAALTKSGFWADFQTDWLCLDTELMPWSAKAQALLRKQYAPVGRAGRAALKTAVEALEEVCQRQNLAYEVAENTSGQNVDMSEVLRTFKERQACVEGYIDAYREYCWPAAGVEDLKIAPFHLLATEGAAHGDKDHVWHMETVRKYITGSDGLFMPTEYILVDVTDDDSVRRGVDWWLELTAAGGEGMVVKPYAFVAQRGAELLQPAVKCRGREYLRIIYSPEYTLPEHMGRLKKRGLNRKRQLALREFSLGLESLERFVAKEPLYRVHECVFAVLAFESEPVDPRL